MNKKLLSLTAAVGVAAAGLIAGPANPALASCSSTVASDVTVEVTEGGAPVAGESVLVTKIDPSLFARGQNFSANPAFSQYQAAQEALQERNRASADHFAPTWTDEFWSLPIDERLPIQQQYEDAYVASGQVELDRAARAEMTAAAKAVQEAATVTEKVITDEAGEAVFVAEIGTNGCGSGAAIVTAEARGASVSNQGDVYNNRLSIELE